MNGIQMLGSMPAPIARRKFLSVSGRYEETRRAGQEGQRLLKEKGVEIHYELTYLENRLMEDYLHDVGMVQKFAALNREAILDCLLKGMKWKAEEVCFSVHNYINCSKKQPVLRKGAVSAKKGEAVVIPVNMHDGVILAEGLGNEDWNMSAPHGAGRIMKREDVKQRFTVSQFKTEMKGIYGSCIGKDTLDEAPFAYRGLKEIEEADNNGNGRSGSSPFMRGTDNTLVGWKEDFNMCLTGEIPSRTYTLEMMEKTGRAVRLSGYSKGGNLAIWSGAHLSPEYQDRCRAIYNYDGPGFYRQFLESEGYRKIRKKIRSYVPAVSIVGVLMEHDTYRIIHSFALPVIQHNPFSWEVAGDHFARRKARSFCGMRLEKTVNSWIWLLTEEEKEELTADVFKVLSSTNAETFTELWEGEKFLLRRWERPCGRSAAGNRRSCSVSSAGYLRPCIRGRRVLRLRRYLCREP